MNTSTENEPLTGSDDHGYFGWTHNAHTLFLLLIPGLGMIFNYSITGEMLSDSLLIFIGLQFLHIRLSPEQNTQQVTMIFTWFWIVAGSIFAISNFIFVS